MDTLVIPEIFFNTHYDGSKYPGSNTCTGIKNGANCQYFAYELLRHYCLHVPNLRSSNLWEDTSYTLKVSEFEPLDLLLFNRDESPYGAHVGVYIGASKVLHLSREIGRPAIWDLPEFKKYEKYFHLIGGKRIIQK